MADFQITAPDGRSFKVTAPEGATKEQALAYAQAQFSESATPPPKAESQPDGGKSFLRKYGELVAAPWEMGASLATGAAGGVVGAGAGLLKGLFGGKYGTAEGAREAAATASDVTNRLTYQPRGEPAQEGMESLGKLLHASKLAGLGPAEAMMIGNAPIRSAATANMAGAESKLRALVPQAPEPVMAGGGAAVTALETLRRERAAGLPVPVKLTKGEATRDFDQQRFEKETMKSEGVGAPLRENAANNVENVIKNFEAWIDETGAEAPNLIGTGKAIDKALVSKMNSAKGKINAAYEKARESGEMAAPVRTDALVGWIDENRSAAKLAPVISAAENELIRLGGATRAKDGTLIPGQMALNDLENARKLIVRLSKADETNGHFGGQVNKVIDQMTEGAGGELYKAARGMFKEYADEFKSQGAVRKLVTTKPNSTDRAVALEDVFKHSVLSGSAQDTTNILKTLEGAGLEGTQAVRELKGATMNYLLEEATKNAARDIRGNPIPSFAKLNNAVRALDNEGKLDLMFGKKGAEQVRDLTALVGDIQTAPPGVLNSSNTGAVLLDALKAGAVGRIPTATAKAVAGIKQMVGDRATMKRVRDALEQPDEVAPVRQGNMKLH